MSTQEYKPVDLWQKANQAYRELGQVLMNLAQENVKTCNNDALQASYMPKQGEECIVLACQDQMKVDLRGKRITCLTSAIKSANDTKAVQVTAKHAGINYSLRSVILVPVASSMPKGLTDDQPAPNIRADMKSSFFCNLDVDWA